MNLFATTPCVSLVSLLSGIGKEQLLAVDPVAGDRRLALRRDQPVDEGLSQFLPYRRMLLRVYQKDAILVEQPLVAFNDNVEIAAVPER